MKAISIVLLIFSVSLATITTFAQHSTTDSIASGNTFDNIYNQSLFSDSLASSFVILIKKEVKLHKHVLHSEHVIVLDGEAEMTLGDKVFVIRKGDVIFIPKNTVHGVKTLSSIPLKVISIQSPYFDGKDRVLEE